MPVDGGCCDRGHQNSASVSTDSAMVSEALNQSLCRRCTWRCIGLSGATYLLTKTPNHNRHQLASVKQWFIKLLRRVPG